MKTIYSLILLLFVLLISSCSNPLEKEFSRETAEADFTRIVKLGLIDSVEASIMSHFMVEHDLIGAQVLELGATYEDILEESKKFWERSGGKKKSESSEAALANTFAKDLTVSIQPASTLVQQSEWSHGIKYRLSMENTSGKSIRAIKGNLAFYDAFGDRVYAIEYKFLDALAIKEKVERDVTLRIQNTVSPQLLLEYGKTNPFTVKWEPVSILFN